MPTCTGNGKYFGAARKPGSGRGSGDEGPERQSRKRERPQGTVEVRRGRSGRHPQEGRRPRRRERESEPPAAQSVDGEDDDAEAQLLGVEEIRLRRQRTRDHHRTGTRTQATDGTS